MKIPQFLIVLIATCVLFIPVVSVSAHLVGQPPFFRINGEYSNLYPVPLTSLYDFVLPQDLAAKNYLVGDTLDFVMETNLLPVPPNIVKDTVFSWDFGDGTTGSGIKNSHKYTKPGSYILTINAAYGTEQPAVIQSVLFNVLPSSDYQLPQAVPSINGLVSSDPLTDVLKVPIKETLSFDAQKSSAKSSSITTYFWDFGDQTFSSQHVTTHKYTGGLNQIFVVLRIKDKNGFISDNFVELENGTGLVPQNSGSNPTTNKPINNSGGVPLAVYIVGGLGAVGVVGVFGWIIAHKKRVIKRS